MKKLTRCRKLRDGVPYEIETPHAHVTVILDGWEGNEERIRNKFAQILVDGALRKIEREAVA